MKTTKIEFLSIEKETDKAFQVSFETCDRAGNFRKLTVWMPKSQVSTEGNTMTLPTWLATDKLGETANMAAWLTAAKAAINTK